MPEGLDSAINATQKEVKDTIREAKPQTQGVQIPEEVYTSKVDEIQSLGANLNSAEAIQYLDKAKGEINQALIAIAVAGSKYLEATKTERKMTAETREAQSLTSVVNSLNAKLNSYKPHITTMGDIEKKSNMGETMMAIQQLDSDANANPEHFGNGTYMQTIQTHLDRLTTAKSTLASSPGLPATFSNSMTKLIDDQITMFTDRKVNALKYAVITQTYNTLFDFEIDANHQITNLRPTDAFNEKPKEEQDKILAEIANRCEVKVGNEIAEASYPRLLLEADKLFAEDKFDEAKTKLQEFEKFLNSPEFKKNPALMKQEPAFRQAMQEKMKLIDTLTGEHKPFFDAQAKLAAGEMIGAKQLLLNYIKKPANPPIPSFEQGAKELLKRIAMTQLEEAEQRFKKITPPMDVSMEGGGNAEGGRHDDNQSSEYKDYIAMRNALAHIRITLVRGEQLDFTAAAKAVQPPLDFEAFEQRHENWNVIGDQLLLEQGRPGLLKLAQKYRRMGNQALAERYYRAYFSERLQKPDILTFDKFLEQCQQDGKMLIIAVERSREIMAQIKDPTFREQFEKQHPEIDLDTFSETKARNMLLKEMAQSAYPKAMGRSATNIFNANPESFGADAQNFRDFADLMGVHRTGTWREDWLEFSDQEWRDFATKITVEIVIIGACAAISGGAGGAVAAAALRRQTARVATTVGEEVAAEMMTGGMVTDSGLVIMGRAAGFTVENGVFTASSHFAHAAEQGRFEIFGEEFMQEWAHTVLTLGSLSGAGRVMRSAKLGQISAEGLGRAGRAGVKVANLAGTAGTKGGEAAVMGTISGGHLTTEDLALIIGLDLGHRVAGVKKGGKSPKPKGPDELFSSPEKRMRRTAIEHDLQNAKIKKPHEVVSVREVRTGPETNDVYYLINEQVKINPQDIGALSPELAKRIRQVRKLGTKRETAFGNEKLDNINTGKESLSKENVHQLATTAEGLARLERLIANPDVKVEGITRTEIGREIKTGHDILKTKQELADIRKKYKNNPDTLAREFNRALQLLSKPDTTIKSNDIAANMLRRLGERSPELLEALKTSDIPAMIQSECMDAVLASRSTQLTDIRGNTFDTFTGKVINAGAMGELSHIAYLAPVNGSLSFQLAAIKTPHDNPTAKDVFRGEVSSAGQLMLIDHPNIIKPLKIGNDFVIYETSRNAMPFGKAVEKLGADIAWELYRQAKRGADELQNRDLYHRDIKPDNILILEQIGPNGEITYVAKVIDINCNPSGNVMIGGYAHSPAFSPNKLAQAEAYGELVMFQGKTEPQAAKILSDAFEAYSHSRVVEELLAGTSKQISTLTPADRIAIDQYISEVRSWEKNSVANVPKPQFPTTNSSAVNGLGRVLNRSHDLIEIGKPEFRTEFNAAVEAVTRETEGRISIIPPPSEVAESNSSTVLNTTPASPTSTSGDATVPGTPTSPSGNETAVDAPKPHSDKATAVDAPKPSSGDATVRAPIIPTEKAN